MRANVVVTVVFLEVESSVSTRQHASAYVCKKANVAFLEGESSVCECVCVCGVCVCVSERERKSRNVCSERLDELTVFFFFLVST